MKSEAALILSFAAVLTLAAGSVFAKYSGGTGEPDDPYKIASAADLQALAADTGDYNEAFILTGDIDLEGIAINPVGNDSVAFAGIFDGNDHVIRNIAINTSGNNYAGLFGYVDFGGQVKNLGVEDVNITGNYYVGGLVGMNGGTLTACYATGSVNGTFYIGGLVGYNLGGTITFSYATGSAGGTNIVGGLVGFNDTGTLTDCYASGSASGAADIAGLVGYNYNGTLTGCFWDKDTSGLTKGVGSGSSTGAYGRTTSQMQMRSTFTDAGWDFVGETVNGTADIWKMPLAGDYPKLSWQKNVDVPLDFQVTKCSVTAGSKDDSDKISFSGMMDANASDFNDANNSADANFVKVTILAENMDPCVFTFPVNDKTFKKGKFSSTITSKPLKMSFAFDTQKTTFSFSASNVDLTGLACPVFVAIRIGVSSGGVSLDETIVNGTKKLIPYQLMMGAGNLLVADKVSFKRSSKPDASSLTVSGRFTAITGPDLSKPMVITVGSQTFTVPGNQFLNKKGVVSCSKGVPNEGPLVRVAAKLDYVKCTFTISVKYVSIIQSGVVDFGIDCFGVNLDGMETIDLGP